MGKSNSGSRSETGGLRKCERALQHFVMSQVKRPELSPVMSDIMFGRPLICSNPLNLLAVLNESDDIMRL